MYTNFRLSMLYKLCNGIQIVSLWHKRRTLWRMQRRQALHLPPWAWTQTRQTQTSSLESRVTLPIRVESFCVSSYLQNWRQGKKWNRMLVRKVVQTQPISQNSLHCHQQQRRVRISLELIPSYKRVSTMTQCYDNRTFINVSMQTRITSQFLPPKWAAACQSWIAAHI